MENAQRIDQLLAFLEQDPNDPFTIYALALEYEKTDVVQAIACYEKLLSEHKNYPGTYYHAARLYTELGQREKAEYVYRKGIEITRLSGHTKLYQELQRAYEAFEDEEL